MRSSSGRWPESRAPGYRTGLSDTFRSFEAYVNHPNRQGHERIAGELLKWLI
ncbi:hypothetical protein MKZ24_29395 [Paenibacillus sp. FSL R7-0297]|uniref:hypothetical protein n=1 Tax=unclassified Paenibacillus TaxID=185978 RepID=UPI000A5ADA05|nr:hypothetical protein [Paenibacillus sp. FSL R5-0912]